MPQWTAVSKRATDPEIRARLAWLAPTEIGFVMSPAGMDALAPLCCYTLPSALPHEPQNWLSSGTWDEQEGQVCMVTGSRYGAKSQ